MKYIKTLLVVSAIAGLSSGLMASQMRVESNTGAAGQDAAGNSLSTYAANSFTFQVGAFTAGFTPTASNVELWEANWMFSGLQSPWVVSGPFANRVRNQANVDTVSTGVIGEDGYVWGYNSKAVDPGSEWVLVRNNSWVFPAYNPLELPANIQPGNIWNLNTAGNNALFGSFVNGNAADGFQLQQAIPEPSTYALIFGLGILGFLGFRRFRK